LQDIAYITNHQNEAELLLLCPLFSLHTLVFYRIFGAKGTFRPLWSGPDQACLLPKAPVSWPQKEHF